MSEVYILGCGAIGLLLAEKLAQRHRVILITRDSSQTEYMLISGQKQHRLNVDVTTLKQLNKKIQTCIVPVKAYQIEQAFKDISPHLSHDANIILSHNGMYDLADIQANLKSKQALFFLSTAMGGMKPAPNTVIFKGPGLTQLGACNLPAQDNLNDIYQVLFSHHFDPFETIDDINLIRWQKLCVNIAINPLTAIEQCHNGALRAPKYAKQVLNLLNEACVIANLEGVKLKLNEELVRAYKVMTLTANNTSSMAQDVKLKRRSEIDAICGFISLTAQKHGHHADINDKLWQQIKQKEQA
ncbi:ketopantoate reductase family protein [Pseudoalteromonas luteoviolacea]|uniref:2-dehydropantoate 2-reductase n=1 Tax=Pseudoalteromonas luteoviolacea S4054 TaxID=1129367 RepID=A0A0F6ACM2_9GAMM|nr:2-dehydropantoate 2-reductase [Pseudoalteromonas luteoviolacea]AOT09659.1 hypothetical protein S4054249_18350 [Pseudoalteromonas luteoviolacea]AOT14572.1 hypothetical protein S40542_18320 [Pseudoalteromonas luteoviolacea]AOT19486.1 hypothetical protein S4054_18325 [Pseudoalteromonas luteoviolacea]KKE83925.1 hypothetical protein N479_10970 [Pseudoalteromonas luteoviolacea S4054]KZN77319.1 hypothetical protein N481_04510 [Pseudoalteromonas luteoviolacea S4047-1]